jgi:hypothetical protein
VAAGSAGAAVAAGAVVAAGAAGALVGASLTGGPPQAASSTIRISVPNHRLRIFVFLSTKKLRVVWRVCDHPRVFFL